MNTIEEIILPTEAFSIDKLHLSAPRSGFLYRLREGHWAQYD